MDRTASIVIGELLSDEQSKSYIRIFKECKRDGLSADDFERRCRTEIIDPDWERIHTFLSERGGGDMTAERVNLTLCHKLLESYMEVANQIGPPPPGYFNSPTFH